MNETRLEHANRHIKQLEKLIILHPNIKSYYEYLNIYEKIRDQELKKDFKFETNVLFIFAIGFFIFAICSLFGILDAISIINYNNPKMDKDFQHFMAFLLDIIIGLVVLVKGIFQLCIELIKKE